MKIRKNDNVMVINGSDRGKKGKVRRVDPRGELLLVDGVNMTKKHSRARRGTRQAGIIELETPVHVSKVMLICNKCGRPVRVGFRLAGGKKVRVCASCHEVID